MFNTGIGQSRLYLGALRSFKLWKAERLNRLESVAFDGVDALFFLHLFRRNECNVFIETGAHIGATSAFMAHEGISVVTCEVDPVFYSLAKINLPRRPDVGIANQESVEFLRDIIAISEDEDRFFFYLDAHTESETPLKQELEIINQLPRFVCVVDNYRDYKDLIPPDAATRGNRAIIMKGVCNV